MRHIAAYLMLVLSGNAAPSADDVKGVLAAVDIEADDAQLERLISSLEGKNVDELIEAGQEKLTKMVAAAGASAAAAAPAAGGDAADEGDKDDDSSSSSAGDGAANLFGGSDSDSDSDSSS